MVDGTKVGDQEGDVGLADPEQEIRDEVRRPPKYAVVLHNDDYTTMEFVIDVLKTLFHKTQSEAVQIMLHVHEEGRGIAGIYSYEIAETKAAQANALAQSKGFPFKCSVEPE